MKIFPLFLAGCSVMMVVVVAVVASPPYTSRQHRLLLKPEDGDASSSTTATTTEVHIFRSARSLERETLQPGSRRISERRRRQQQRRPHGPGDDDKDNDEDNDQDQPAIVQGMLLPRPPVTVEFGQPNVFAYRTSIPAHEAAVSIRIYLARYPVGGQDGDSSNGGDGDFDSPADEPSVLVELGRHTVIPGTLDWMMVWTPKEADGVPPTGGHGFVLLFKRTAWWGWRKEEIFESRPFVVVGQQS